MAHIEKKKSAYPISDTLRTYLNAYGREQGLPIRYTDLLHHIGEIPVLDKHGQDTFWVSLVYPDAEVDGIHESLKSIYSFLQAGGNQRVQDHLFIERVDLCLYGNSQPFRVRIVNKINDNFDYFYIKHADASRVFGLELEDLLSPNSLRYVVNQNTLIEEHIAGIPGEEYMRKYVDQEGVQSVENETRLAKEFVKFNERCFVRLLGDMHSSNYVVVVTPDFDDVHYRIRAIDFDQQSYEPRSNIYQPKYFKQNNPIIQLGIKHMTHVTMKQYQTEERAMMASRIRYSRQQIADLLDAMEDTVIAPEGYTDQLKQELAEHYENDAFLHTQNMSQVVRASLNILLENHTFHDQTQPILL